MKKIYCSNCGKYGHENKTCEVPIISVGIICVFLNECVKHTLFNDKLNLSQYNENINNYNYKRLSNLSKIEFYKDKINFLMIERKHSLNYIEFIRGLYDVNDISKLNKMFSLMSKKEHNMIKGKEFDLLWNNLWQKTANKKEFKKEYLNSKKKFNIINENNTLDYLLNNGTQYETAEWELPKGRRNPTESNLECAKREFFEETGYDDSKYTVINNTLNISDTFTGTNGKEYKHIYYIVIFNEDIMENSLQNKEVNKVSFLPWEKAITKVRSYYQSKINLLNDVFLFFMNLCEDIGVVSNELSTSSNFE